MYEKVNNNNFSSTLQIVVLRGFSELIWIEWHVSDLANAYRNNWRLFNYFKRNLIITGNYCVMIKNI